MDHRLVEALADANSELVVGLIEPLLAHINILSARLHKTEEELSALPRAKDVELISGLLIEKMVVAEVAKLPPPPPGKEGPPGPNGRDADLIELTRLLVPEVERAVAMLPKAERGADGPPGEPGLNGKDGANGLDGKDGAPGRDGIDGKDGMPGRDGKDGANGLDGKDGAPGRDGIDGKDGPPGRDGKDGAPAEIGFAPDDIVEHVLAAVHLLAESPPIVAAAKVLPFASPATKIKEMEMPDGRIVTIREFDEDRA